MVLLQQRLQPVKIIEKIKTEVLEILSSVSLFSLLPGSVGVNIPKMLELFKFGHDYMVEKDCYVRTQIATVRLKTQHVTVFEEELKHMSEESLFKSHRRIFFFTPFFSSSQLDMASEHIFANLQTILIDVCSHRPADMGTLTKTSRKQSERSLRLLPVCQQLMVNCV